jgi:D-serine deaminase-like pyridoxal phosphate-dependent protein
MVVIGSELSSLDTPALWVDLDLFERNILHFRDYFRDVNLNWRPHIKGIKIPALAQMMVRAGAAGITCAKLSEAEVMAAGGLTNILIANQVVGESKVRRLANLNRRADVMAAVDSLENARQLSSIAEELHVTIPVLAELDIGMHRCGVQPGQPALDFCLSLAGLPGIDLRGLMGWEGHVTRIEDPAQKKLETERAVHHLVETAALCRAAGLAISIVSCGGTGSYTITAHIPGVTEIQAGGGAFGDVTYQRWGALTVPSLFILATVISHPSAERAVIDAGRKAMNVEYSMPRVMDMPGVELAGCTAEHGILSVDPSLTSLQIGDRLNLAAGYEDLTVFLHDQLIGVRCGRVEAIWAIQARGKLD